MSAETPAPERVANLTGNDVVLHIGCSEEWASWSVKTGTLSSPGETTQVNILLKDGDGFSALSDAAESIQRQLDGGDPKRILPDTDYSYRVGLGSGHARDLLEDLEAAIEFGADAHNLELLLTHQTLQQLTLQFQDQV